MSQYETILVPTDGSEHAEKAAEVAFRLAEENDAVVHTLFVVDTHLYGEPALGSVAMFIDELDTEGSDLLSELVGRANERGIVVERAVRHGEPAELIVDYADEIEADLLVMGHQGHSHRRQRGSIVERVLDDTDRHVLVI
ncbi:universal stress protein [Haloarcula marina]|uniref:universal stress protein n=1 Tax=Haloarcula marina TaxID=2961574 RepID=UPI0020B80824|nr:universal stress protein [Halomicroarcula marina]